MWKQVLCGEVMVKLTKWRWKNFKSALSFSCFRFKLFNKTFTVIA